MFDEVYRQYAKELYHYALGRLHSHEDAEDVVSQVFCEWLNAIETGLYEECGCVRAWLYIRLRSRVVDYYRRHVRCGCVPLSEEYAIGAPDEQICNRVLFYELWGRASMMPPQRAALAAHAAGERTRETAVRMGRSVQAVKALRIRGYAALRKEAPNFAWRLEGVIGE